MSLERQSPSAAHWSQQQYDNLFLITGGQQGSGRLAWVAEDEWPGQPGKVSTGLLGISAFLVAKRVDQEWELENIVVAEAARRRGVGMHLVGEFIAQVRSEHGTNVFLEVRQSNQSARALYRKLGFEETGLRKAYYANPPDDAVIYGLSFR
jgi:ribosomal protein S18 acetylase RimI-like enzyme